MKVVEKGTDRFAEVHVCVEGAVKPLGEYGQYIDANDKAICCYVPVVEGHKVQIRGNFAGTTLTIAYDAVVDGVYRKADRHDAKTVHQQRSKKLDVTKFLCSISKDTINTDMSVAPISRTVLTQGEATETIGTIELRVYITRQLGVEHAITGIESYHSVDDVLGVDRNRPASYKQLPPTFRMAFEENSELLNNRARNKYKGRMDQKRPGTGPWAIFRFHYRSPESIEEHNLKMSFDPQGKPSKAITEAHILDHEPVPPLPLGTKPAINDGDTSTRAASVAPPEVPSTPVKSASKATTAKTPTSTKTQSQFAFLSAPKTNTTMATENEKTLSTDPGTDLNVPEVDKDLLAQVFKKSVPKAPTTTMTPPAIDKPAADGNDNGTVSSSAAPTDKVTGASKDGIDTRMAAPKDDEGASNGSKAGVKPIGRTATKATDKPSTASAAAPAILMATAPTPTSVKGPTKKVPQVHSSSRKPPKKPAPITTAPNMLPAKRTGETTGGITPDIKRAKTIPTPNTPTPPATPTSQIALDTLSSRPFSIERKVAEQRKKLDLMRQKRIETVKKQEELDKKMEPYKKRMAEELERLEREMLAEEAAAAEAEKHLMATEEMLKEFEMGDGAD